MSSSILSGRNFSMKLVIQCFRSLHVAPMGGLKFRRPGMTYPNGYSREWIYPAAGIDMSKYTHEPLPYVRWGGRGPDGRIALKHIGGGLQRPMYMVDKKRLPLEDGKVKEEKVLRIHKNWWQTPLLALVGRGQQKRWIIGTKGMKEGDIIRSYGEIPTVPVNPVPGDAHPLGALPVGTMVCQVERIPGEGAIYATQAGSNLLYTRKVPSVDEDKETLCIVRLANKKEIMVSERCMAVVGQNSNETHMNQRFHKFGQKRWLGIRQRSGLYQKKTGRFGRKIKPIGRPKDLSEIKMKKEVMTMEYTGRMAPWNVVKRSHIHKYPTAPEDVNPKFRWCAWATYQ